jgi:hypothetical protein
LKEEQEYFSWVGLLMAQPPQPPPENAPWRYSAAGLHQSRTDFSWVGLHQSTKERNCGSILLRIIIVTKKKSFDINKKEKNQGSKKIE